MTIEPIVRVHQIAQVVRSGYSRQRVWALDRHNAD